MVTVSECKTDNYEIYLRIDLFLVIDRINTVLRTDSHINVCI